MDTEPQRYYSTSTQPCLQMSLYPYSCKVCTGSANCPGTLLCTYHLYTEGKANKLPGRSFSPVSPSCSVFLSTEYSRPISSLFRSTTLEPRNVGRGTGSSSILSVMASIRERVTSVVWTNWMGYSFADSDLSSSLLHLALSHAKPISSSAVSFCRLLPSLESQRMRGWNSEALITLPMEGRLLCRCLAFWSYYYTLHRATSDRHPQCGSTTKSLLPLGPLYLQYSSTCLSQNLPLGSFPWLGTSIVSDTYLAVPWHDPHLDQLRISFLLHLLLPDTTPSYLGSSSIPF